MAKLLRPVYLLIKRRFGPAVAGVVAVGGFTTVFVLCFVPLAAGGLTHDTYETLSQIGATMLVAFAVEIAGVVKDTRASADQAAVEEFAAGLAALGGFGVAGVLLALVASELSQRDAASLLEALAGGVAIGSVVMLGVFIAIAPMLWWWKRQTAIEHELATVED